MSHSFAALRRNRKMPSFLFKAGSFVRDGVALPFACALCLFFVDIPHSTAEAASEKLTTQTSFDIPSQALSTALIALANQGGIQILFEERIVRGYAAPAIKARQTPVQALDALLSNTTLEFTARDEVVAVRQKILASAMPASALGQSATIVKVAQTTVAQTQSQPQEQERGNTIEEVIVTAERREASAQRSSLSIQVIGEDQLERVTRPVDLSTVAPGVQIGMSALNPQVYIRGVGDNVSNSRGVGAIPFHIDGVHLARGGPVTTQFFDLARVEVLKGPQGTLYGRNASGGAINLITAQPRLGEVRAYFEGSLGNYNQTNAQGMLNVPVGETVAIRLSGQVVGRDGFLSDGGQEQKYKAGRLRMLWEPNSQISLLLSGDASHMGGEASGNVLVHYEGDPWRGNIERPLVYPFQFGPNTLPYTAPTDRTLDASFSGVSAELNADLGFATLTVLPAYRWHDHFSIAYGGNFRTNETLSARQTSVETRLSNTTERLNWVAGAYYFRDRFDIGDMTAQNNLMARQLHPTTSAKALFGQTWVTLAPNFRVIGGLRYTEEEQYGTYQTGIGALPLVPFTPTTPLVSFTTDSHRTNWKAGVEYDAAAASMLYATVSTGFKAGGYQPTTACGTLFFEPEDLKAYEVGAKNRFLGDTLQVNLEGFLWDYTNQQVGGVGQDPCGAIAFVTQNVGESTIKGGSIDVVWRATRSDTIRAYLEYADGKYDDFSFVQSGAGVYMPGQGSLCSVTALGGGMFRPDCSGLPSIRLPKWAAQLGYEHVFDLGGLGALTPSLTAQYASERWLDIGYAPNGLADSYEIVNAKVAYDTPDGKWKVTAFIDNAFNGVAYTQGSSFTALDANGYRYYGGTINAPRMYGLTVRVNF